MIVSVEIGKANVSTDDRYVRGKLKIAMQLQRMDQIRHLILYLRRPS